MQSNNTQWYRNKSIQLNTAVWQLNRQQYDFAKSVGARQWTAEYEARLLKSALGFAQFPWAFAGVIMVRILQNHWKAQDNEFRKFMLKMFGKRFLQRMNPGKYPL